jgi:hypothetical protein
VRLRPKVENPGNGARRLGPPGISSLCLVGAGRQAGGGGGGEGGRTHGLYLPGPE